MFHNALVAFAERRGIMMNRAEMNAEMMEQVNGGYSWEEFKEDLKKAKEWGEALEPAIDAIRSIPRFW